MAPLPELRQLRYFVAVAQARSFSRAAATEHISQQGLSQQVRAMEDLLGVQLLERTSRGVEVTPAGEVLLREGKRVIAAAERAVTQTAAAAAGRTGILRLGHTLATASDTVPHLVRRLADCSPRLQVAAMEYLARDLLPAIVRGEVDLGLAPSGDRGEDLDGRRIAEVPLVLAVAAADPLAALEEVAIAALADRTIHVWPRAIAPGYHDAVVAACTAAGVTPRLDTSAAGNSVWSRIAAGPGVGLIAAGQAPALPASIAVVPLAAPVPVMGIDLLWRADEPPAALGLVLRAVAP